MTARERHVLVCWLGLAAGSVVAGLACGDDDPGAGCLVGQEGCTCDESSCAEGLTCLSGLCVAAPDPSCGNGIVEAPEECDNGQLNADDGVCKSDCTLQVCGDGAVGANEACDDGNLSDMDLCTSQCTFPSCGNGVVEGPEACDDGNDDNTDDCLVTCLPARCGDGFVRADGSEACDDGNTVSGDGCSAQCELEEACGDGQPMFGELCFAPPVPLFVGQNPSGMGVGDPNGDGWADLVVALRGYDAVVLLAGDGEGEISLSPPFPVAGTEPAGVAVGDVDGDGFDDVATADSGTGNVSILFGTGVPTLTDALEPASAYYDGGVAFPGVHEVHAVNLGPGDGQAELLLTHEAGVSLIVIEDSMSRDAPIVSTVDFGVDAMLASTAADVDGDGLDEVVVLDRTADELQVVPYLVSLHELEDAADLPPPISLTAAGSRRSVTAADLDGDSADDLLIGTWDEIDCSYVVDPRACDHESFERLMADGVGGYRAAVSVQAGRAPSLVRPADLDGDGSLDVVVANRFSDDLEFFLGDGTGALTSSDTRPTIGHQPVDVAVVDLNADDIPDVASLERYTNSVTIFFSNP